MIKEDFNKTRLDDFDNSTYFEGFVCLFFRGVTEVEVIDVHLEHIEFG